MLGSVALGGFWSVYHYDLAENSIVDIDTYSKMHENDIVPPVPVPVSLQEVSMQPKDTSALGGYNVLIADRGNNRVIEVTPDKKIVWEYDFKGLPKGYGADDSFFADGGKSVIVNLEYHHLIEIIDYATKKIIWQYGTPGTPGSYQNYVRRPDDAYKLPNGDVIVADIQNCRVIEISPDKKIVHQYGKNRQCSSREGYLDVPNGDTPLPNGHVLISTITNHSLIELDQNWQPIFSMSLPIVYPSDPQLTAAGTILVASYQHPGKIIEITKAGSVTWEFDGEGATALNRPSLAIELPNGNILSNDDYNHRVIVIDKQTKQIIWQYGVMGKPGRDLGQLSIPDGLDIIKRDVQAPVSVAVPSTSQTQASSVGSVTRHAATYLGQNVLLKGYVLKQDPGYAIFSDEPSGVISQYDLPITGEGVASMKLGQAYRIAGTFLSGSLIASNGNPDHLELSTLPQVSP